jgi:hypothetical protein
MKSYKKTPFAEEVKTKCIGYEKLLAQQLINAKNPKIVFEWYKDEVSSECKRSP